VDPVRQDPQRFALLALGAVIATAAAPASAADNAKAGQSLTLYEQPSFQGQHVTYRGAAADLTDQGFTARSARSAGLWTLCEGRALTSRCQTVNGAAARLKLAPAIVRPGVDAVALYEKPGLKGRRVVYSFSSDQTPGFRPRSARTWGGPWSLCDASGGRCEIIDGAKAHAIDIDIAAVRPGTAVGRVQLTRASERPRVVLHQPERLQFALADPPPEPAPLPPPQPPLQRRLVEDRASAEEPATVEIPTPALAEDDSTPYDVPIPDRPPPPPRAEPVRTAPRPAPAPRVPDDGLRHVAYQCEDGRSLKVVFDDWRDMAEILSQDEDPVFLKRVSADRGFRYEDWGRSFSVQNGQASYVSRDREPLACWAPEPRRQLSAR
jgi:membrane-bound inhibitor of C-type lysozyme